MNKPNFSKNFVFNFYKFNGDHLTDNTKRPVPMHFFGCIVKGTANIKSKTQELQLLPNEIFYIPKGLKYRSHWFGDNQGQLEFYSFGFSISPIDKSYALQKLHCSETAKRLFDELCLEIPLTCTGIGKLYCFLGEVTEHMQQTTPMNIHPVIEKATEYMTEQSDFKITDVAAHCHVSVSGLYATFKKQLNTTPNELRQKLLCEKAISLLSTTDKSVQEVSDILGFSSVSYFRKVLKKHVRKTPLEIRKEALF